MLGEDEEAVDPGESCSSPGRPLRLLGLLTPVLQQDIPLVFSRLKPEEI